MTPAMVQLEALHLACYLGTWAAFLAWGLGTIALHYFVGSEVFDLDPSDCNALSSAYPLPHPHPVATAAPPSESVQTREPCIPGDQPTRRLGPARSHRASASHGEPRVQGLGPVIACRVRHVGAVVKPSDIPARPLCHTIAHDWTRAHGMARALGGFCVTD